MWAKIKIKKKFPIRHFLECAYGLNNRVTAKVYGQSKPTTKPETDPLLKSKQTWQLKST